MERLIDRLDSRLNDAVANPGSNAQMRHTADPDRNTAPVFLIRDAATDAGVRSPETIESHSASSYPDVISTGLVALPTAHSLLEM